MDWQPIETAPKDGKVLLSYRGRIPVFIAWSPAQSSTRTEGFLWWRKPVTETDEAGWRVVMWFERGGHWAVDGNIAPFKPTHWAHLDPPEGDA